jgi:hypothetical protein
VRAGPDGRRFLAGFEAFGVAALFVYLGCARLFTRSIRDGVEDVLERIISPGSPSFPWSVMILFLLPQAG